VPDPELEPELWAAELSRVESGLEREPEPELELNLELER
jgi:hypothetical protein